MSGVQWGAVKVGSCIKAAVAMRSTFSCQGPQSKGLCQVLTPSPQ